MNYTYPQQQQQYIPTMGYRPQQQQYSWAQTTMAQPQVRLVSSIEEVRACPIDFDGSVFYFSDIANKKIYTKFINVDGTATINLYELKEMSDQPKEPSYVTREEFDQVINQFKEMIISKQQETSQPAAQKNEFLNIF